MKIGVIGASGVLGRRLVPRLAAMGLHVRCVIRRSSVIDYPETCTVETIFADILNEDELTIAMDGLDVVVNLASHIPDGKGKGDWQQNDRIRIDGSQCLLNALARHGNRCRLIQQSVAMLHLSDRWVDEEHEVCGQGILVSALVMEKMIQSSAANWVLIRGSAVYGPDTARDAEFFRKIRQGLIVPPEDHGRWISLVHIDDLVSAFIAALDAPVKQVFIATDDRPLTYQSLFAAIALPGTTKNEATRFTALPSFRVRNQRLKSLGWCAHYRDVFQYLLEHDLCHVSQINNLEEGILL